MEKRAIFSGLEKVTRDDFNNLGLFPEGSIDTIVRELLIPDIAFAGFQVVQSGPAQITVGSGHLYNLGKVYFNDTEGGSVLSLLDRLPSTTQRIIAVTIFGSDTDTELQPRTFMTDVETRAVQARAVSTEHWRWANIGLVSGAEGPDPQAPSVAADVAVVAYVTVSNAGIVSIQQLPAVRSLRDEDNRLNEFDIWRLAIGTLIDTLRADLLALAARINGLASFVTVRQLAKDVATLKENAHIAKMRPALDYVSYGIDHFLTTDYTDLTHVDQLSKVLEGVRFPPAAGFDMQLGLLNPLDTTVINSSNVLLPAWDHVARVTNLGTDAEDSIAQYQYQTTNMTQKMMSRTVTRYGTPFTVCTNSAFWTTGTFDYQNWTFNRGGEVFNIIADVTTSTYTTPDGQIVPHGWVRLEQVWQDTIQTPYWDRVVTTYAISGSVIAETFVNSQDGWLSKIDLQFSRVAASGDVVMLITEAPNGVPDPTKVIARTTAVLADLKVCPKDGEVRTSFLFNPTFLVKGRYGILVITAGNHYVWTRKNTNDVAGTYFHSTDGAYFQGDVTTDLAFEAFFCSFRSNMTTVQLNSLTLTGGIAAIEINADSFIPAGAQMYYEVQVAGVWHRLDNVDGGPDTVLIGLPPLLPFRVVFIGTNSIQPALGVASNSRVTTWRPGPNFVHISTILSRLPAAPTIQVDCRVEAWRGAPHHTFVAKLLHGATYATVRPPDVVSSEVAPDDPNALIYHFKFTGMGSLSTYRLRLEGTTDNVLATFHVAERFDITTNP
jgi:hypothetical protein